MAWYWPFKSADSAPVESTETAIVKAGPQSFTTAASTPGPTKPAGADGVAATGGFLVSGERDARLTGRSKWVTYDNATLNVAIISAATNVWTQLAGSAKWTAQPNPRGGAKAHKAADIITQGLLEAQMSIPWKQVVRRQVMKKFRGFALHEMVIRRRSDGMVVCADLGDRPQWTIYRWDIPDEQTPWQGVEQMTQFGNTYYIPRERLLYSVENTLSATPDGVGLLRQMAEHVRVLELYQQWEGIGFQTDLRGIPVAKAPLQALRKLIDPTNTRSESEVRSGIQAATKFLTDFLMAHNKRSDQGIMLDSATFPDVQGNPTGNLQWAFDLIKGASSAMPEINTAIGRITREIARVMQAEWLMLGGEDSGGAYSMHEDKTAMFALIVNSALEDVADDATRDCATRLVALNGLDPETCTPKLVPEPIATGAVKDACTALMTMFQAGLDPRDPAINVLRSRLNLPPAPTIDETQWVLHRGANVDELGPGGRPTLPGGGGPSRPGLPPGQAPKPGGPQGEAGNPNARPDAEPGVAKYAPDQPREPDGRWGAGGGGSSMAGGVRPWTLAFDDRDHQRVIDQHRRTEADSRAKANAAKEKIAQLRASGGSPAAIRRLSEQRDQHRAAAVAARDAKQAAQAHMEAARAEHVATRRAAAAERNDAQWERARQEAESAMAIGQHRIGGSEGQPDVAPVATGSAPTHHVTEADTAAAMERASADLQRQSDAMRAQHEHADLVSRLESQQRGSYGRGGGGGVSYAEKPKTQEQINHEDEVRRQRERASDDRAEARNRAAKPVDPAHAVSLPEAHTHHPTLGSRLRNLIGRKRHLPEIPVGLDATQIAKFYADAMEDQRLDEEALMDEIELEIVKFDEDQPRAPDGKWTSGGGPSSSSGESGSPRDTAQHESAIASAHMDGGKFTPETQKIIREQVRSEIERFGLRANKAGESGGKEHVVTVLPDAELAGAGATMNQANGEMKIGKTFAEAYQRFYGMKPEDVASSMDGVRHATLYAPDHPGRDAAMAAFAHRVVTHEQIHVSGPQLGYFKYGVALEEISTEMCARAVHASVLGMDSRDVRGSYNQLIYRNVVGFQQATGVDARTAYGALEHASLEWKRQPDTGRSHTPEEALKFMSEHALRHVGVHDESKTAELGSHMVQAWRDEVKAKRM